VPSHATRFPTAARARRPRWVEGALVVAAVLAAHAWLLADAPFGVGATQTPPAPAAPSARPLTLRVIVAGAPARPAPETSPPPATPSPTQVAPAASPTAGPGAAVAQTLPRAELAPRSEHANPAPDIAAPAAGLVPAASEEGAEPPVYPTRVAPPTRLGYDIRRGALAGRGELVWQHDERGYELSLSGTVVGLDVIGQVSRGGFDVAGLAPERFVERRRGRDRHAANFDRTAGRITFSGPAAQYPLMTGAQDRLSWMIQLPAIVDADPGRWTSGTRIAMFIAGSRGDGEVWVFSVAGPERLDLPAGRDAHALRLTRAPRRPYDTQVEVWLDPARHHLPVRARLTTLPGGETLELTLAP
jgi:Protein of unknown function (DUF3108)